jgi:hypothetical protein
MIQLKPKIENMFTCPACGGGSPAINGVAVKTLHVVAACTCRDCGFDFSQVFPVGHHVEDLISFSNTAGTYYKGARTESWLFDSLVKARQGTCKKEVAIEKIVFRACDRVVILNTLDYLYGHVLLKLYNSLYHLDSQPNLGLIVIIPKMFQWLIPVGCAEAWVIDLKLSELAFHHESVENFVAQQFERFQGIYISKAYSHPDVTAVDIARLTKVKPFDLSRFAGQKPVITFVLRQDRWWFQSRLDYWFYRVCRRVHALGWGSRVLTYRQNQLVKRAMRKIKKRVEEVDFYVVGVGRYGSFDRYVVDKRENKIDDSVEMGWCRIYAKSHVVVGVHGSNMLLPTALAAGCVEVLPQERYGNMVQDITVRYVDRRQLFFYRFADQYSGAASVADKAVAMIRHYDSFYRNMCVNLYRR